MSNQLTEFQSRVKDLDRVLNLMQEYREIIMMGYMDESSINNCFLSCFNINMEEFVEIYGLEPLDIYYDY